MHPNLQICCKTLWLSTIMLCIFSGNKWCPIQRVWCRHLQIHLQILYICLLARLPKENTVTHNLYWDKGIGTCLCKQEGQECCLKIHLCFQRLMSVMKVSSGTKPWLSCWLRSNDHTNIYSGPSVTLTTDKKRCRKSPYLPALKL